MGVVLERGKLGGVTLALAAMLAMIPPSAEAQSSLSVGPEGAITFTPGLRVQTRYAVDDIDDNQDFYVARVRIKGGGDLFGVATYYTELKLDNVGRFARTVNAQIENAWVNFPLTEDLSLRVGLYDAVFSRDALTSDSKLLMVDRSLVKDGLTAVGLADNTVGVLLHGRPRGGRIELSGGFFDNLAFEGTGSNSTRKADGLMTMGRVAVNLLDPAPPGGYADYRGSYIGQGRRLSIGLSAAYLQDAQQDTSRFGLDGQGIEVFFNSGRFTAQAEIARYDTDPPDDDNDQEGMGGYAQAGFLVLPRIEVTSRFQQFDANSNLPDDRVRWTSVGANFYIRDHNLKVQTDFTVKREQAAEAGNNVFQVQLQLDF